MFKVMVLLKRKPGLTLQQFIDHYETRHAPLGVKYQTKMVRYIRHFLTPAAYTLDGAVKEIEYDVLTELWFEDRDAYDAGMALMMEPEANEVLAHDEERFLDRSKSRFVFIEEHESELPQESKDSYDPDGARRVILLKRRPDLTIEQFIDYYENHHAPLGIKHFGAGMSRYRRFYLRPAPYALDGSLVEPAYDVMTTVWRSAGSSGPMSEATRLAIEEDEGNFTDKSARRSATVETHESPLPWVNKP